MNKKEVLEILGSNPSEYEIRKAYGKLADENLDGINSHEDLKFYLYTALCGQDIAFLKKLFSKFKSSKDGKFGDYVNEMYLGSYLPLHFIRILERSEIVELLLKHGANPDIKNKQSETPLIRASNSGYYKTVEILLKYSASLSVQDEYGEVPLHKASYRGHYKIVELLLKHGANPDIKNKQSETPLHKASYRGHYKIVELLLKHGADLNIHNIFKRTPLFYAVCYRGYECEKEKTVELLLKYGGNPNEKIYRGRSIECTPYFANNGIINCIKTLVLPYGSDDKVKKLMAEYGGVDRRYLDDQTILACSCLIATGLSILYVASPWCYVTAAVFALAAYFFIKNAVHAAFFTKTKEPSPEFAEVITEKVVDNVELNAKDNKRIDNALA